MTHAISTARRPHGLLRIATTWLAAAAVLGLACPHCRVSTEMPGPDGVTTAELAHAAAAPPCHAAPPIHVDPANPSSPSNPSNPRNPSNPTDPPMHGCDCAGCDGLGESVPPAKAALESAAALALVALPPHVLLDLATPPVPLRSHTRWLPPPYPGFAEQTVVMLN